MDVLAGAPWLPAIRGAMHFGGRESGCQPLRSPASSLRSPASVRGGNGRGGVPPTSAAPPPTSASPGGQRSTLRLNSAEASSSPKTSLRGGSGIELPKDLAPRRKTSSGRQSLSSVEEGSGLSPSASSAEGGSGLSQSASSAEGGSWLSQSASSAD